MWIRNNNVSNATKITTFSESDHTSDHNYFSLYSWWCEAAFCTRNLMLAVVNCRFLSNSRFEKYHCDCCIGLTKCFLIVNAQRCGIQNYESNRKEWKKNMMRQHFVWWGFGNRVLVFTVSQGFWNLRPKCLHSTPGRWTWLCLQCIAYPNIWHV